jgi:hypothetical protein
MYASHRIFVEVRYTVIFKVDNVLYIFEFGKDS